MGEHLDFFSLVVVGWMLHTFHRLKNYVRSKSLVFIISPLGGSKFSPGTPLLRAMPYSVTSRNRLILLAVAV